MTCVCPFCSAEKVKAFYVDSKTNKNLEITYYKCDVCYLIFQDPGTRLNFDDEKLRYDSHNNDSNDTNYVNYIKKSWDFLAAYYQIQSNDSVLDFGCGASPVLPMFSDDRKVNFQAYDPYYFNDKNVLKNNSYEAIFCIEALEHFYDLKTEFSLLVNLLKTGGYLCLRTGVLDNDAEFANWWYHKDPTHVCFLTAKTLVSIQKNYNLKLIQRQGDFVLFQKY